MEQIRFHGTAPYIVAVVHGGPGAQGSAWPLARALAQDWGVLEPMQSAMTVQGQVDELCAILEGNAGRPAVLVGHSWGAWLALLAAAHRPDLARKVILVGSGPFEERWTAGMMDTRLGHLSEGEAAEARAILEMLQNEGGAGDGDLARFGALMAKADTCCAAPDGECYETACDADVNRAVWAEAAELRRSGRLLELARQVACPVTAIHGDYDPHPWQGVKEPLETAVKGFRFVLLERCGHEPWAELHAREQFIEVLRQETRDSHGI